MQFIAARFSSSCVFSSFNAKLTIKYDGVYIGIACIRVFDSAWYN